MIVLGIETSCDETAAAVIEINENTLTVLSSLVNSQIQTHEQYGGVVPEVAAREHMHNMLPIVEMVIQHAKVTKDDIDVIAVTQGPGLATSLMVGLETAKAMAYSWNKPLLPVNHMLGHVYSWLLPKEIGIEVAYSIEYPFLALLVSGGHTELVKVKSPLEYELLGRTLDDAVGEAFDKVAKMLGLSYPGGPAVSKAALEGDDKAYDLPRPMINSGDYDFSYAGLKTAVLYQLQKISGGDRSRPVTTEVINNMAASFEKAAVDILVHKVTKAIQEFTPAMVTVAGGVSANQVLRKQMQAALADYPNVELTFPELKYTGDNAAMIALAGGFLYRGGVQMNKYQQLSVQPNLKLV